MHPASSAPHIDAMPVDPQAYRPATDLLALGDAFYDPVEAADFPETRLRFRNDPAAAEVGLNGLSDDEWVSHFGRFVPLPEIGRAHV